MFLRVTTFGISSLSPLQPHILAHVAPTVHRTSLLLVAREICANSYFIWFVGEMRMSFINVEPISQLKKVYEFSVYVGFPVQGVIYDGSSKLWLYFECNPVTFDVVWRIYGIHVFPPFHHKRYVGRNLLHGLSMKSVSFLIFGLLCFKWL